MSKESIYFPFEDRGACSVYIAPSVYGWMQEHPILLPNFGALCSFLQSGVLCEFTETAQTDGQTCLNRLTKWMHSHPFLVAVKIAWNGCYGTLT